MPPRSVSRSDSRNVACRPVSAPEPSNPRWRVVKGRVACGGRLLRRRSSSSATCSTEEDRSLDEPTVGLDSVAKLAFRDFIRDYNQQRGLTVILTTHDMDDIEALYSRVMVIGNGQILSDGPLDELRNRFGHERLLTIDFVEENVQFSDPQAVVVSHAGHRTKLRFNPNEIAASELISRVAAQHPVRDLFVENPPIEEIIARIYQENHL